MAIYQWKGSTGSSINRYDWNHAPNWLVRNSNGTVTTAATPPGAGDDVYVGASQISQTICQSPLLYGGFTGTIAGGSWTNSGGTGHTFNTAMNKLSAVVGDPSTIYRFPILGGGISGLNYEWLMSASVTGGGMYGEEITFPASGRQLTLNLKAKDVNVTVKKLGYCTLNFVPNLSQFNGATAATSGSAGTQTSPVANNTFVASNGGELVVKGGIWDSMVLEPDTFASLTGNAFTALSDAVCTNLRLKSHSFFIDNSVTAGYAKVDGGHFSPYQRMKFNANVDMNDALAKQYPAGSLNSSISSNDSTLHLVNPNSFMFRFPFASIAIGSNTNLSKTTRIGRIIAESSTDYSDGPDYPCPWSIEFSGNVLSDEVKISNCFMSANQMIPKAAAINLNSLRLDNGSTLDLGANKNFDNWEIGGPTSGGIFFEDEHSQVIGSRGQRMYLTQMSLGGRFDSRLSVVDALPIVPNSNILPTQQFN